MEIIGWWGRAQRKVQLLKVDKKDGVGIVMISSDPLEGWIVLGRGRWVSVQVCWKDQTVASGVSCF